MGKKVSAEDRVREIRRKTRKKYSAEGKVRIVLERCEAKKASLVCAEGKGFRRISTTAGARSFSRPERNDWPETQSEKRLQMKSPNCDRKTIN